MCGIWNFCHLVNILLLMTNIRNKLSVIERFASITINLGPTFLSGTMAANISQRPTEPSCPLVQGPYRHYILNFLWIFINIVCIILTIYHLIKLYRDYSNTSAEAVRVATLVTSMVGTESDSSEINEALDDKIVPGESLSDGLNELRVLTADPLRVKMYLNKMEREGIDRVKMFLVITIAYLIFWGPLFLETLIKWGWMWEEAKTSISHEVISSRIFFQTNSVRPISFNNSEMKNTDLLLTQFLISFTVAFKKPVHNVFKIYV